MEQPEPVDELMFKFGEELMNTLTAPAAGTLTELTVAVPARCGKWSVLAPANPSVAGAGVNVGSTPRTVKSAVAHNCIRSNRVNVTKVSVSPGCSRRHEMPHRHCA